MNDQERDGALSAVRRVENALQRLGITTAIVEFAESTRTAEEAARAIGTTVERIVKSLIFMAGDEPLLVLASGINRVDTEALGRHLGTTVRRANADYVRRVTGFAIGGVPPVGHATAVPVVLDRDLLDYDRVYAAAGTPHAVFPIAPDDLCRVTDARVLDVKVKVNPDCPAQ